MPQTFPAITDHSWARPAPAFIKGMGYLGVLRYIGNDYGRGGRDLSLAEMNSYLHEGLKVGFIVQGAKDTVRQGARKGIEYARMANDRLSDLGVPRSVRIISTAIDYEAPRADLVGPIAEFHRAFNEEFAWAGGDPYGNDRALNVLVGELGLSPCGWQTRAWSGGRVSPHACMMQEVGYVLANTSDHNSIYDMIDVERLIWHPDEKPGSQPTPDSEEEDDMPQTYMLTSTRNNRAWLTRKNPFTGISPGMLAGIVSGNGDPIDGEGQVLDGGWDSNWAGLTTWESMDGSPFIRPLSSENVDFLKACMWAQSSSGQRVTITDLGFQEDRLFSSKTAIARDALI